MNKYERRQPRTSIHDLDPRLGIKPLAEGDLRLVAGGGCAPMTTHAGEGDSWDVPTERM